MTLRLIRNALHQLAPALFEAKLRHDRVRPSLLDPTLTTAIAVPNHPAYPSGHAAEAGLIAEILSVLSPSHRGIFLSAARRIAVNREIAGLHYRSDSQAGFELARAFVQMAQTEPWFAGLLKYADVEWRAANH
jgi:acid phosphatase (class A)